jgi:prefoldin subunit 5
MGAAVSMVRDQIEKIDDAKGKEQEVKEALENMRQTAQDLLDNFNERIRYVESLPTVPSQF